LEINVRTEAEIVEEDRESVEEGVQITCFMAGFGGDGISYSE
jgi:hypothetical protein